MTTVSYPGVYVEEIPGGARPIEAAGTSTAAFVGVAEKGPDDRAVRLTSWDDFQRSFGGYIAEGYLAESVYEFFNNGGRQCYVVRVTGTKAASASVTIKNRADEEAFLFSASSKGAWGNSLYLWIRAATNDAGNTFDVSVYQQDDPESKVDEATAKSASALESFEGLDVDPTSKNYFKTRIDEGSGLLRAQALELSSTPEISGFHWGGWGPTLPLVDSRKLQINVNEDGFQEVELGVGVKDSTDLDAIAVEIKRVVRLLTPKRLVSDVESFRQFECAVGTEPGGARKGLKLSSGTTGAASSVRIRPATSGNATSMLKLGEAAGGVSFGGLSNHLPKYGTYQVGDEPAPGKANPGVDDNASLVPPTPFRNAFKLLDRVTDVSLLAVPGVPGMFDEGVAYCENRPLRDIFFIGEMTITDDTPAEAEAFRKGIAKPNTYGAVFFPWIKSPDISGRQTTPVLLPPSGFIAGLFARIDSTRGVWKAPAGTEATLSGAVGLASELNDIEQGNLNRIGVNCIRRFDLAGIVCWGARTVYSDPEYKYVPVRRTAIMLRRSIYDGIQWAVFEPNDHRLWAALRLNIGAFMNGLFRAGAFQGETSNEAYFVRCGLGDTMTQDDIDRGQVVALVGFAALKPAEFVIVRIQQKVGQT